MKSWDAFYPEVRLDVPGCSDILIEQAVRDAAIELCSKTWTWIFDQDPIHAIANQAEYELEPPAEAKVARVLDVYYQNSPLTAKTPDELTELFRHSNWRIDKGTPEYYMQKSMDALVLVPMPSASLTNALRVTCALKPSKSSKGIEDWLFEEYLELISFGAKARLLRIPKQPWTDPAAAADFQDRFNYDTACAKDIAQRGHTRARRRTKAYYF